MSIFLQVVSKAELGICNETSRSSSLCTYRLKGTRAYYEYIQEGIIS